MLRHIWKFGALCGVVVLVMLVAVPIASAHHPVIVASLACNGTVTFTVTADIQNYTRNNADVAVIDTSGQTQPVATGAFTSSDNWSFSGSFTIPVTVNSDTLTPQALGIWGDGVQPSNGPSTTITRPQNCPPPVAPPAPPPTAPVAAGAPTPAPAVAPAPVVAPSVAVSTPTNPAIAISKSPKSQTIPYGSTATFTIVVTNTGDVPLSNVFVTDALSPACSVTSSTIAELAAMAPGASTTYTCLSPSLTSNLTNVATDTGTPPSGPDVTATDTATVTVMAPFTPPVPTPTKRKAPGHHPARPVSGSTSFATSHTAPFTPPVVKAKTSTPKLVSHVSPKTAG
jgi:uncharacterized repeat protein (TIGR01451 family)